jgi:hypothetical protein
VKSPRSTRLLGILNRIDIQGAAVQVRLDAVKLGPECPEKAALWRRWTVLVSRRKKIQRAFVNETRLQTVEISLTDPAIEYYSPPFSSRMGAQ